MIKFELNEYHKNTPDEDFINDLKRVAAYLKKNTVSSREYNEYGKFATGTLQKRFGSWNKTLEKAELEKTRFGDITDEQSFGNIEEVWIKLGRQPKYLEMQKPLSRYPVSVYIYRYGGWRKALEKFVEYVNKEDVSQTESEIPTVNIPDLHKDLPIKHKTKREISGRLRFIVMQRDNFKCKIDGRSPATDPTIVLHVDHIKAWSKGGETVLDNLQTLCSVCNLGKSNLEM